MWWLLVGPILSDALAGNSILSDALTGKATAEDSYFSCFAANFLLKYYVTIAADLWHDSKILSVWTNLP